MLAQAHTVSSTFLSLTHATRSFWKFCCKDKHNEMKFYFIWLFVNSVELQCRAKTTITSTNMIQCSQQNSNSIHVDTHSGTIISTKQWIWSSWNFMKISAFAQKFSFWFKFSQKRKTTLNTNKIGGIPFYWLNWMQVQSPFCTMPIVRETSYCHEKLFAPQKKNIGNPL